MKFLTMCSVQCFALGNNGDQDIALFIKILGAPRDSEQVTEGRCSDGDCRPGAGGACSRNIEPGLSQGGFLEEEVGKGGHRREREQLSLRKSEVPSRAGELSRRLEGR